MGQLPVARTLAVALTALVLVTQIARLTASEALAEDDPVRSDRLAPKNPAALVATAMAEVGVAAAEGREPGQMTMERFRTLSAHAPLRPEPFLVKAALSVKAGDLEAAEALLKAARARHPRSVAARYLLADTWIRQGRVSDGLRELAILARLAPDSSLQVVPALSEFARTAGAEEQLAPILDANPSLKKPLLLALAGEPGNASLILSLAGPDLVSADPSTRGWKVRLLTAIIAAGDYRRAFDVWRRMAGNKSETALLFNPDFRELPAPPPFNWRFNSGAAGVAEPQETGLRVLYYAREDSILASQVLLLASGGYQFRAPASGAVAEGALAWRVSCMNGGKVLMSLPVGSAGADFEVPPNCPAQRLDLVGSMLDMPKSSDVRFRSLTLERAGT